MELENISFSLQGHRLHIVPNAMFQAQISDASVGVLDIALNSGAFARIFPDQGGYRSQLSQNTASLYDVVSIQSGPTGPWAIETPRYRFVWPCDCLLLSDHYPSNPSPFVLKLHNGLIYTQTPQFDNPIEQMCLPGQRVISISKDSSRHSILVEYLLDGARFQIRHTKCPDVWPTLAVTVQAPAGQFPSLDLTGIQVLQSISSRSKGTEL
jgi:hypothetical protein